MELNDSSFSSAKKRKIQSKVFEYFQNNQRNNEKNSLPKPQRTTKLLGTQSANHGTKQLSYSIFCDLDGVLVDFEAGVKSINRGRGPDDMQLNSMWRSIAQANNFFERLPWTKDGKQLWQSLVNELQHLKSLDILTGVPSNFVFREQKFKWCKRELAFAFNKNSCNIGGGEISLKFKHVDMAGKKKQHYLVNGCGRKSNSLDGSFVVNVITCWSKNKHRESKRCCVLIDDREDLGQAWTEAGGIFIHHKGTNSTLAKLKERGILQSSGKNPRQFNKASNTDTGVCRSGEKK